MAQHHFPRRLLITAKTNTRTTLIPAKGEDVGRLVADALGFRYLDEVANESLISARAGFGRLHFARHRRRG